MSFLAAGMGASGKRHGSPALHAPPSTRAIGVRPYLSTAACEASRSAAAPSEICEALPAVSTPSLPKAGRRPARLSAVVSRADALVHQERLGLLAVAVFDAHDLVLEVADVVRVRGAAVALGGHRVDVRAGDAVLGGGAVGLVAHRLAGEGVREAVALHQVE